MSYCDSEYVIYRTYSEVPISSSSQTPYNQKEESLRVFTFQSDIPAVGAEVDNAHNTTRSTGMAVCCSSERVGRVGLVSQLEVSPAA